MRRLFLAIHIKPTNNIDNLLENLKNNLKYDLIKWVNSEQIHLTLKFFGNTSEENITPVIETIRDALKKRASFIINLRNIGIFGSRYNPKVIWLGISNSDEVKKIYSAISESLKNINIYPDRQNFVSHFTLGRIKKINDKKHFQKIIDMHKNTEVGESFITEVILFESVLNHEGAIHKPLHIFKLEIFI